MAAPDPATTGATPGLTRRFSSASPEETRALAGRLSALLRPGDFLALSGDLGAGKTCFVQGLAAGLHVEGRVSSPTFVLLHYHPGPLPLCHLDAYRLDSAEELELLGLADYAADSVIALEWAERVPEAVPAEALLLHLSFAGEGRVLEITARGARPTRLLEEWSAHAAGA